MLLCVQLSAFVICFRVFFFKQKTAYEMRISDWSSDVCFFRAVVRRFIERADDATADELVEVVDEYAKVASDDHDVTEMLAAKDAFYAVLGRGAQKIGRASCRERVCQYV